MINELPVQYNKMDATVLNRHMTDINPLVCGWMQCWPSHSYGPGYREYYLFHYVLSGKGKYVRAGETYHLKAGDLFLIRPGELIFYQADEEDPWAYVWIGFSGTRCEEFLDSTAFRTGIATLEAPYLGNVFNKFKEYTQTNYGHELALCAGIYEMLSILQEKYSVTTSRRNDYVARTIDFITANFAMPITIENIAKMVGIDRRYLCRIFAAEIGQTPQRIFGQHPFGARCRVFEKAQRLRGRGGPQRGL